MTTAGEPVERKSSRWRLTVREAVLAILAIGLLAVLAVEHQPWTKAFWGEHFSGSEFLDELTQVKEHEEDSGDDNVVAPICNRLVSEGKVECSTNGFGGAEQGQSEKPRGNAVAAFAGAALTDEGVNKLQEALPDCTTDH